MNKRMVGWTVGMVLLIEAAFMLPVGDLVSY